jgi:hypothetical protein
MYEQGIKSNGSSSSIQKTVLFSMISIRFVLSDTAVKDKFEMDVIKNTLTVISYMESKRLAKRSELRSKMFKIRTENNIAAKAISPIKSHFTYYVSKVPNKFLKK